MPLPNKVSCFVSTSVFSANSFLSVRQEPTLRPWKGSLFFVTLAKAPFLNSFRQLRARYKVLPGLTRSPLPSAPHAKMAYFRVRYREGRQWHTTPVLLPRKSHGWRSLVGRSPWGRYESDTTEWLHFHFSLSCNGKGNGNPLQCTCLENPRDCRAWWAPYLHQIF